MVAVPVLLLDARKRVEVISDVYVAKAFGQRDVAFYFRLPTSNSAKSVEERRAESSVLYSSHGSRKGHGVVLRTQIPRAQVAHVTFVSG